MPMRAIRHQFLRGRKDGRRDRSHDRKGHQGHQPPKYDRGRPSGPLRYHGPVHGEPGRKAVLAETREQAVAAAQAVGSCMEPLPVTQDARPKAWPRMRVQIHERTAQFVANSQPQIRGDAEAGLAQPPWGSRTIFPPKMNPSGSPWNPRLAFPTWKKERKGRSRPWW